MKRVKNILSLAAGLLVAGLQGCSDQDPSGREEAASRLAEQENSIAVTNPPEVLALFNVGEQVYVRSLAIELPTNSLWVGTSYGVHEIDLGDHSIKNTFTRQNGLANEYVFAIGIDKNGYKWFGTNAGGVSRYKDGNWQTYFPMHGLADYWVYAFESQKDGTLWIGTWAGVNSVDLKSGAFTTYVEELVNEWVYGIAVDSEDRVWFATEGGVSRFDGREWQSWTHDDGIGAPNKGELSPSINTGLGTRARHDLGVLSGGQATYNPNYVFSIAVTPDDVVWAGTWGGGVSYYKDSRWNNYSREDGLAGNIVYSVLRASDGVMWFGTNGGVSRFDGSNWRNYGLQDGLPDLDIYALKEGLHGDIWAGTKGAVVRIGIEEKQDES